MHSVIVNSFLSGVGCSLRNAATPSIVCVTEFGSSTESLRHRFIRPINIHERQQQLPLRYRDVESRADREAALLQPAAAHAQKWNAIVSASS